MIKRIAIVLAVIVAVVLGRGLFFYKALYQPPSIEMPSYESGAAPVLSATEFSDIYARGEATILIDLAHDNQFEVEELDVLLLRLTSRDSAIRFLGEKDSLKKELLGKEDDKDKEEDGQGKNDTEKKGNPEEEPTVADAFIVVCPQEQFSNEEIDTLDKFVNNGGKLLLIAEPTRPSQVHSLSIYFGLIFEPDYLYNLKEYDANFRNIFISEFKSSQITEGIEKIALYIAGSISSAGDGIAFVDENTFSSVVETRKDLSPLALTSDSKVLAIHDLTFITEPYNGMVDNDHLISNIADWLSS